MLAAPGVSSASLPDMAAIAARFAPIVVNISVTGIRKVSTASDALPDAGDDPDSAPAPDEPDAMRDFLRNFQQRFGGLPPQLKLPVRGEGSGFIVRADGLILTNAHGVADADEVRVRLSDRREIRAKALGSGKLTDIALPKIEAAQLPAATLASPGSPSAVQAAVLSGDLPATVGLAQPGDAIELEDWHLGTRVTRRAPLDDANRRVDGATGPAAAAAAAASGPKVPTGRLGLSLRPLQPDEKRASGVTGADQAGELVARPDEAAALLVQRGGTRLYVALRLD